MSTETFAVVVAEVRGRKRLAFTAEQRYRRFVDSQGLGTELLIVLQPSLAERASPTPVEEQLLAGALQAHASRAALTDSYEALRRGLASLGVRKNVHFLDCSRLFDSERATTFADLWHFSDRGHELLGQALARALIPLLAHDD